MWSNPLVITRTCTLTGFNFWMDALLSCCQMVLYSLGIIWSAVFWRAAVEFATIALHLTQTPSKKVQVGPRSSPAMV